MSPAIETATIIISSLGGWTAIQYGLDWFKTRKSTKTKDNSDAFTNEFNMYKTQIEFFNTQIGTLQTIINDKDTKIKALTDALEELQTTVNNLFNENQEIKKALCTKYDCTSRDKKINN